MNYKLEWKESIRRWDEAAPLGSGKCGCLCWGTPEELRFSLDRTDIWEKNGSWSPDERFTYQTLCGLARKGDTEEIRNIFDAPYYEAAPTKLSPGKLLLRFPNGLREGTVVSSLSLLEAEAQIQVQAGERQYHIRTFVHATRHAGILEVDAPLGDFFTELVRPSFGKKEEGKGRSYDPDKREISQGSTENLRYPDAVWGEEEKNGILLQWFAQPLEKGRAYAIVLGKRQSGSKSRLVWSILSSEDGADWLEAGKRQTEDILREDVDILIREHRSWWKAYFDRSGISLPDRFLEKQWYLSNYLFASCSRKGFAPMPLQGVWTADDGMLPPWKGDYHHDLNTELSYSHYLKANHLEEGECFLDFLWGLLEEGKKFAGSFYGTEGCCLPAVMTIDGKPLGGWPMYSLSPTNQIWLCQSFVRYFQYTGDMDFLEKKAYPYVRETGICMEGLLEEREDGRLYLPVSSSPEIHDDTARSWLTPMSNYDLALLQYLFEELYKMADILKLSEKDRWKNLREKLPRLAVNEKKVLMLSPEESLEESHRHFSNAMAVCPLELIPYRGEGREIIDAVIADYERLGTSQWVGYTFTWMAHLYGIQGNGEKAKEMLEIFWRWFCGPNGFHLNGDYQKQGFSDFTYRPFTLEGNMFGADALQEMLFQMKDGEIRLFPAAPKSWKEEGAGFDSFRGEAGLVCSARIVPGKGAAFRIKAGKAQKISVRYEDMHTERLLAAGEIWEGGLPVSLKRTAVRF